jgi:tetratricopeptide (TPR) repeat protein
MKQRWQRIRPVMWTLTPIVGVAMLFLLPWLVREVRPLSSDALFQEARAELGATRALSPKAAAVYVRALVRAGDADKARAFVQFLPPNAKPCAQHELIRALIDTGELNRALHVAREHLRMGNYQHCWSSAGSAREYLYWYLADELLAAGRLEDAWTVIGWIRDSGSSYQVPEPHKHLVRRSVAAGRVDLALQALQQIDADYTHAETLLVVQALLEQGQSQRALDFLSRQIRRV